MQRCRGFVGVQESSGCWRDFTSIVETTKANSNACSECRRCAQFGLKSRPSRMLVLVTGDAPDGERLTVVPAERGRCGSGWLCRNSSAQSFRRRHCWCEPESKWDRSACPYIPTHH